MGTIADALIQQSRGASLDQALTKALRNANGLHPDGRRQVVQNLYGINRHRARLGWHLEQLGEAIAPASLLSAWLAFTLHGQTWDDMSGVEDLKLMRRVASRTLNDPDMPENVRLECPPAFESRLRNALGKYFSREMSQFL